MSLKSHDTNNKAEHLAAGVYFGRTEVPTCNMYGTSLQPATIYHYVHQDEPEYLFICAEWLRIHLEKLSTSPYQPLDTRLIVYDQRRKAAADIATTRGWNIDNWRAQRNAAMDILAPWQLRKSDVEVLLPVADISIVIAVGHNPLQISYMGLLNFQLLHTSAANHRRSDPFDLSTTTQAADGK